MKIQTSDGPIKIRTDLPNEVNALAGACNERELLAMVLLELREIKRATRSTEQELQVIKMKMRP